MDKWKDLIKKVKCCECGGYLVDTLTDEDIEEIGTVPEWWYCSHECYES